MLLLRLNLKLRATASSQTIFYTGSTFSLSSRYARVSRRGPNPSELNAESVEPKHQNPRREWSGEGLAGRGELNHGGRKHRQGRDCFQSQYSHSQV